MSEHAYLHALNLIPGVGGKTLEMLVTHFGSAEAIWSAHTSELLSVSHIGPKTAESIGVSRTRIDPAEEWEKLQKQHVRIIASQDAVFPALLKEIPDAPYLLYISGTYDFTRESPMLAVVGSRKFTSYGKEVALRIAEDLTRAGILVVSGMAFGIDSAAHESALDAGGETLAVLGSGVDPGSIYPQSQLRLAERIEEHGALISEYAPGTKANTGTFPARNRIVAGMTLGTIVVEAAERSGALITANLALQYNREIFAVPGSIFSPLSQGTNRLIKSGAKLIQGIEDIFAELPELAALAPSNQHTIKTTPEYLSPEEERIIAVLSHEPLHVDRIIKAATLQTAMVNAVLTGLEIKGLVKNIGGMHYIRM